MNHAQDARATPQTDPLLVSFKAFLTPAGIFKVNIEVVLAVVVRKFFAGLDCPLRPDPNPAADDKRFTIGTTGVVDVSSRIAAWRAIDSPLGINSKEILAVDPSFNDFIGDIWPCVLDDSLTLRNGSQGK